jgi:ATP citrate (pro-S)-lyase
MHTGIIQSILDYDFLIGKKHPSIVAIIAKGRVRERFFWGTDEVSIRVYPEVTSLENDVLESTTMVVNAQSSRHVKDTSLDAMKLMKNLKVMTIFAENTPERHALEIHHFAKSKKIMVIGPSSVGLLIPGFVKLGAIGGTLREQILRSRIESGGDVAIITTSGGVANELIHMTTSLGHGISFALAVGGDRYPVMEPSDAFMLAEKDKATRKIVYFGELGGRDEYVIAELIKSKIVTKPVIAYVAGKVAELFPTPPQFGHAKALAQDVDESASAKKKALREAGAIACESFEDIARELGQSEVKTESAKSSKLLGARRKAPFMSRISGEKQGDVYLLGRNLIDTVNDNSLASLTISMLLGHQITSKKVITFVDYVLRLLADHSPNVSGAVNTMITSRAGKDLVSSLASGLLTIGPRFGGAINAAARNWLEGVATSADPQGYVSITTNRDGVIAGIGHKKYRTDLPDPRVEALSQFSSGTESRYLTFARSIEAVTLRKKSNLILNVDGVIAAVMLDLLRDELKYSDEQLKELVDIEFFNALFVLSRSIGFTAHYLDQRRNDEGLFRLENDDIRYYDDEV